MSDEPRDDADERARRRRLRLEEEGTSGLAGVTTAEERLGVMWRLALDGWAVRGVPCRAIRATRRRAA